MSEIETIKCPSCGASIENTNDNKCIFCGALFVIKNIDNTCKIIDSDERYAVAIRRLKQHEKEYKFKEGMEFAKEMLLYYPCDVSLSTYIKYFQFREFTRLEYLTDLRIINDLIDLVEQTQSIDLELSDSIKIFTLTTLRSAMRLIKFNFVYILPSKKSPDRIHRSDFQFLLTKSEFAKLHPKYNDKVYYREVDNIHLFERTNAEFRLSRILEDIQLKAKLVYRDTNNGDLYLTGISESGSGETINLMDTVIQDNVLYYRILTSEYNYAEYLIYIHDALKSLKADLNIDDLKIAIDLIAGKHGDIKYFVKGKNGIVQYEGFKKPNKSTSCGQGTDHGYPLNLYTIFNEYVEEIKKSVCDFIPPELEYYEPLDQSEIEKIASGHIDVKRKGCLSAGCASLFFIPLAIIIIIYILL